MKLNYLLFILVLFSCQSKEEEAVSQTNAEILLPSTSNDTVTASMDTLVDNKEIEPNQKSLLEVKTIHSDSIGYGYEIYNEGKLYIRQPIIPAVSGNHGFKTESDALRTGNYVKEKIEKGIMPPSLTIEELKKLKVY